MDKRYDDGEVRWVLAHQMVMRLSGVTPVDLDDEYDRYLATSPAEQAASLRGTTPRRRHHQEIAIPSTFTTS